jgi:transcriptional regulator with XRE-family HTH domain
MSTDKTTLGRLLRGGRERKSLSLRAVERATGVSNAYLSQVESGKIRQPSPVVLHKLAELYELPYATIMERAGYPMERAGYPAVTETGAGGEAEPFVMDSRLGPITTDEEHALREYLEFLRSRRGRKE